MKGRKSETRAVMLKSKETRGQKSRSGQREVRGEQVVRTKPKV